LKVSRYSWGTCSPPSSIFCTEEKQHDADSKRRCAWYLLHMFLSGTSAAFFRLQRYRRSEKCLRIGTGFFGHRTLIPSLILVKRNIGVLVCIISTVSWFLRH
jgi:hypothetical protein